MVYLTRLGLHAPQVRFGQHALSDTMLQPSPTGLCQVNLNNQNTRIVVCVENGDATAPSAAPAVEDDDVEITIVSAQSSSSSSSSGLLPVTSDHPDSEEDDSETRPLSVAPQAPPTASATPGSNTDEPQVPQTKPALVPGFSADKSEAPQIASAPPSFSNAPIAQSLQVIVPLGTQHSLCT
eukprot:COSAG02_NODE_3415_length_6782_cov_9.369295_1_plen_181_part_00